MSRSRLLVALFVAAISLLGYFGSSVFNPITQEKQHVARITPEQEVALGLQAAPEMAQQFGGPRHAIGRGRQAEVSSQLTRTPVQRPDGAAAKRRAVRSPAKRPRSLADCG